MNPEAVHSIANSLQNIISKTEPPNNNKTNILYANEIASYSLPNETALELDELKKKLLNQNNWSERFSEKFISNLINRIISLALQDKDFNIEEELSNICLELDSYDLEQTVYLPVFGMKLENDLIIGNVQFKIGTEGFIKQLTTQIENLITTTKNNQKDKEFVSKEMITSINEELLNKTIAEYIVVAEPGRALERAKEEIRRAFEIIRFASGAIYSKSHKIRIGLKGEAGIVLQSEFIFSNSKINQNQKLGSSVISFQINEENLATMERIGCFTLSEIVKKSSITEYERLLLQAVHWISNASKQDEIENSLLSLFISLESLFTTAEYPITNIIAESAALIISTNLNDRILIKKKIKKLYTLRSAVAHGGKKPIKDSDILELTNITGNIIIILLQKTDELNKKDDLTKWIEELKFGPPPKKT